MKKHLTVALLPPVGAVRYGCGSACAAPVTVFWLFGMVSIVFGLFGGPTGEDGISWVTIALGFGMWGISAVWALVTMRGESGAADPASVSRSRDRTGRHPLGDASFDEVKKAH